MMKLYHIPAETALGGAETMYPEYRKKTKRQLRGSCPMRAFLLGVGCRAS